MKKLVITTTLLLLLTPTIIFAAESNIQNLTETAGREAGFNVDEPARTGVATIAGIIVRAFLSLLGILFIVYTIYGGYLWMTAAGNEERVTSAKSIIRNGIIGLLVIFSAAAIFTFIGNALIGTDSSDSIFSGS